MITSIRTMNKHALLAVIVAAALLLVFPQIAPRFWVYSIVARGLVLGIIALSLVFLTSQAGIISLAQMTVAGFAAYLYALTSPTTVQIGVELPWPFSIAIALLGGTALATVIGVLSSRTRDVYILMITLALSYGFYLFVRGNYAVFNGMDGFSGVRPPEWFGIIWSRPIPFYYLALICAIGAYMLVRYVERTQFGVSVRGMRDSERRIGALGYPVAAQKIIAFAVAGLIASVGGLLFTWYNLTITPGSVDLMRTLNVLVIAVIGGVTHAIGPFVGGLLFTVVDSFAIDFFDRARFNTVIGMVFVLVLVFSPDGIVGIARRVLTAWKGFRAAPGKPE